MADIGTGGHLVDEMFAPRTGLKEAGSPAQHHQLRRGPLGAASSRIKAKLRQSTRDKRAARRTEQAPRPLRRPWKRCRAGHAGAVHYARKAPQIRLARSVRSPGEAAIGVEA